MEENNKRFALMGAAGFIAPRHFRAIKDTGGDLVAACDRFDCVGILDSFFPNASFFTEDELFDRHLSKLKSRGEPVDFMSVCTPNYLHDAHIRYGLRSGAHVICEKPLVLNPWNIDALQQVEQETGLRVYNILQLRLHPVIMALKKQVTESPADKVYELDLTYITSRGNWYYASWKGDTRKSGGLAANIGVHFYDMLAWIFGAVKQNTVHVSAHDRIAGFLELERARVRYFLSINYDAIPQEVKAQGKRTFRSLLMDNQELEFSDGFTELHTLSYRMILEGKGFGLEEAKNAIEMAHTIRHAKPLGCVGDYHPLARLACPPHPFGW
ncbi:MAG: Gfo/Idh/MocA family oxidoreductase [Bacteroidales bacterium]|nr:Gfo/Idh/MocA family oxidoreductase [Bacteroidales bacterium]MCL2738675.1 Gfo/Idh/MocA family oxidoreductase [Bacteroidales bacterium]